MPNYPEYEYGDTDETLYATDAYSGSDADLDNTAPVDDTDGYTADIDLTQKLFAALEFVFTPSNATDNLVLKLFKSLDNSWDGDELPIQEITVDNSNAEELYPFLIDPSFGPGHYRFSMQSSGATTTFDIKVLMRRARLEIATT